jgi:hypothetical protein
VLYIDVAKVDRDVTHVVMVIHVRSMVQNVCSKCFICSRYMLQVFYLDAAKVDLDVAYICILQAYGSSVFMCFLCMFASISSGCCICLLWFSNAFQTLFRKCFRRLFQMFHLSSFVYCNCCI